MAISYVYTGQPMNGTANDDFVIGFKGSTGTDNNTINGNGGDDWVMADSSDTWIPNASYLNGSIANAFNLETLTSTWTTSENPLIGNSAVPHTTVIAEATIGQSEFYRVAIGAGQTITIDIDFGSRTSIGVTRDLVIELQDSLGNIIATADDSLVTDGGLGSFPSTAGSASSYDPYLSYALANAGVYYINVRPFGGGPGSTFTENNTFVMNVSVTGHAVSATNPVMGSDIVNGGAGNDSLFGQGGGDTINGGTGDDFIDGGSGIDTISGGDNNDTIYGGNGTEENVHGDNGDDILHSGGEGHYYGDAGNDRIYAGQTLGVNEFLDGGTGVDTLDTTSWNGSYVINMVTGATNFGESFTNFENLIAGNGSDTITGTSAANIIKTGGGTDTVLAGAGDDKVAGGADGDTLDGGDGSDTLDYSASNAAVTISLAIDTASGGHAQGDTIANFEDVIGSVLGDILSGDVGSNVLTGAEGNDILYGDAGNDVLNGGVGNDVLYGGIGRDGLNGNSGADRFVFKSVSEMSTSSALRDYIADFSHAEADKIDLSGIDANAVVSGNQAFTFIGPAGFHGVIGELRAATTSAGTEVYGDINGDAVADFDIHLKPMALVAGDFIL